VSHAIWKWRQPSLGFPLMGVFTPNSWIAVGRKDGDCYICAFRDHDLVSLSPIIPYDPILKWKNGVLSNTNKNGNLLYCESRRQGINN
jgi:hypothetical protein